MTKEKGFWSPPVDMNNQNDLMNKKNCPNGIYDHAAPIVRHAWVYSNEIWDMLIIPYENCEVYIIQLFDKAYTQKMISCFNSFPILTFLFFLFYSELHLIIHMRICWFFLFKYMLRGSLMRVRNSWSHFLVLSGYLIYTGFMKVNLSEKMLFANDGTRGSKLWRSPLYCWMKRKTF